MTPEAQRIAIAEASGLIQKWTFGSFVTKNGCLIASLPDYLSDLNAMHEAVMSKRQEMQGYAQHMRKIVVRDATSDMRFDPLSAISDLYFYQATAAQRAEAFLRTLHLWVAS